MSSDPVDFLTSELPALSVAGIFGIVSLLAPESRLLADASPVVRRGAVVASLLVFLLATAVVVSRATVALFEESGDIAADLWYALVVVAALVLVVAVSVPVLSNYRGLFVELLSFVVLASLLLGYVRVYPADRFARITRIEHAVAAAASYPAVAVVIAAYPGLAAIVPTWEYQVVRVAAMTITGVVLHLAFSEGFRGLAELKRTAARGDLRLPVSGAVAIAQFGVLLLSAAVAHRALESGWTTVAGLRWESFLLIHWLAVAGLTVVVVWIDRRLSDEFAWGPGATRSHRSVERGATLLGLSVLAVGVIELLVLG